MFLLILSICMRKLRLFFFFVGVWFPVSLIAQRHPVVPGTLCSAQFLSYQSAEGGGGGDGGGGEGCLFLQ